MNRKGQVDLWEVTLLLALIVGVYIYVDSHRSSTTIDPGAQQINPTTESKPVISLINFTWSSSKTPQKVTQTLPPASTPVVVVGPAEIVDTSPVATIQDGVTIGHLTSWEKIGLSIVVILVTTVVGGLLDAIGGDFFIAARRFIMPSLLSCGISLLAFIFNPVWWSWLIGIAIWPAMGTLTLPYAEDGNFGRALWLFIQSVVMGLFLVIISYLFHIHYLAWWLYLWYVITTGIWGGKYKNLDQFWGDWITGGWLCSISLYVFLSLLFSL